MKQVQGKDSGKSLEEEPSLEGNQSIGHYDKVIEPEPKVIPEYASINKSWKRAQGKDSGKFLDKKPFLNGNLSDDPYEKIIESEPEKDNDYEDIESIVVKTPAKEDVTTSYKPASKYLEPSRNNKQTKMQNSSEYEEINML